METCTIESSLCPRCHVENPRHLNECQTCGTMLPWVSSEAMSLSVLQAEEAATHDISMYLHTLWLASGSMAFLLGAFLWCGNALGFDTTLPGAGHIMLALGGTIIKRVAILN